MDKFRDWLNEQNFDFVKYRYIMGGTTGLLVVLSWALFFFVGPNWGIDFTGGTELQLRFEQDVQIGEVREALRELDLSEDSVQQVGRTEENTFKVRIQDPNFGADEAKRDIEARLAKAYGADWVTQGFFNSEVGARYSFTHGGAPVKPHEVAVHFADLDGVQVQPGAEDNQLVIQLPGLSGEIEKKIGAVLDGKAFEVESVDSIGPRVGADLRRDAFVAIVVTIFLIILYVAFRFEPTFAPGNVLALFHDVSLVIGVFVLLGREFNLPLIGALLTIVGYSMNDTIVIYDRIRENREKYRRKPMAEIINLSVNETLTRTISTSFNTALAILPFLLMGGSVLQDFALAMGLGIIFGSYSTIYVASTAILVAQEWMPLLAKWLPAGTAPSAPAPDAGDEEAAGDASAPALTESEKRRRERAEREKAAQQGERAR
jgi:preprotein translocase subunit SecF